MASKKESKRGSKRHRTGKKRNSPLTYRDGAFSWKNRKGGQAQCAGNSEMDRWKCKRAVDERAPAFVKQVIRDCGSVCTGIRCEENCGSAVRQTNGMNGKKLVIFVCFPVCLQYIRELLRNHTGTHTITQKPDPVLIKNWQKPLTNPVWSVIMTAVQRYEGFDCWRMRVEHHSVIKIIRSRPSGQHWIWDVVFFYRNGAV